MTTDYTCIKGFYRLISLVAFCAFLLPILRAILMLEWVMFILRFSFIILTTTSVEFSFDFSWARVGPLIIIFIIIFFSYRFTSIKLIFQLEVLIFKWFYFHIHLLNTLVFTTLTMVLTITNSFDMDWISFSMMLRMLCCGDESVSPHMLLPDVCAWDGVDIAVPNELPRFL